MHIVVADRVIMIDCNRKVANLRGDMLTSINACALYENKGSITARIHLKQAEIIDPCIPECDK